MKTKSKTSSEKIDVLFSEIFHVSTKLDLVLDNQAEILSKLTKKSLKTLKEKNKNNLSRYLEDLRKAMS